MTTTVPFEILVATMYRSDFAFLEAMFSETSHASLAILVINQTDDAHQLTSLVPNIRVINSPTRGLSISRNLALEHAIGDICLLADDDISYHKDFDQTILSAFEKNTAASIITFRMQNEAGVMSKAYTQCTAIHHVSSVEIAFKRSAIHSSALRFDPLFGLGAPFPIGEDYLFVWEANRVGLLSIHHPYPILTHSGQSSGMDQGKDEVIQGRAAIAAKKHGRLAYLWVLKYLRFLIAHKYITFNEAFEKTRTGFKAVTHYLRLQNE